MGTIQGFNWPGPGRETSRFLVEKEASECYIAEYERLVLLAGRTSLPLVASHTSALRILGVELPRQYLGGFDANEIHLSVGTSDRRYKLKGAVVHKCSPEMLESCSRAASAAFEVVSPELALAQMATVIPLLDLVVLGDCMMRRGVQKQTTKDRIRAFLKAYPGFGGHKRLAKAVFLMREDTDSSFETRQRIALACRGLGSAQVNVEIASDRESPWVVDMAYPELMTIVEYDGRFHMTDANQGERDKEKRGWLRSRGWEVLEVTNARLSTSENRDLLALDVAKSFSKALDVPVRPLACKPIEYLTDRRRIYRAAGLESMQLTHYFVNRD